MKRLRALESALPGWARRRLGLLLVLLIAIPYMVTVTLVHTRAVSPIDEWVYLDYLEKFPQQGMVREGELMSDHSLETMACIGVSPYGPIGPACDDDFDAEELSEFPNQGLTTASPYTPVYFAVTWSVGQALSLVGIDVLDGWRLSGVLWLAGSLVLLFRLFRQVGVGSSAAVAIALAYVASPYSWWTYSYVGTDAPSVVVGAALLTLAIDHARGRPRGWLIFAVGVVGTIIKLTNAIGVALVLLYLVIVAVRRVARREDGVFRLLWPPTLALVTGVAAQFAWLRFVASFAAGDARPEQGIESTLDLSELLLQTTNFLPGTIGSSPIGPYVPGFVYAPLAWMCVTGVVAAVFRLRARQSESSLVLAIGLASVLAAPMLAVALQIATSSYFQLPPRYGATILPGVLMLLGTALRFPAAKLLVGTYSGALLIVGVWLSAHLALLA